MTLKHLVPILATAVVAGVVAITTSLARPAFLPDVARAKFTEDGAAELPAGYRQWSHIGTRYKPIGVNILDGAVTRTPEIFNAYVEPGAMAVFTKTGRWPEGTQIVKEFSAVMVGPGCNPATFVCVTRFGAGIYETGFVGLGYMVKDSARFPKSPGHWGFFTFGHKPPPYEATARFDGKCVACHITLASDSDYVISAAHIGLANRSAARGIGALPR